MSTYCMLYTTYPSLTEAKEAARQLLNERMVACCNILPNMHSLYHWDGAIEENSEVVLIAKTENAQKQCITEHLSARHPYHTPCILFYEITDGNPPYLQWLNDSLKKEQKSA